MANNVFQVKRTNTSGRTPNTTGSYATNSQYIAAGEFALNMADGILYSSNGSAVITVGSNLVNQRITNSLTLNNDKQLRFNTVNTSASAYFVQQSDDNFVFYTTNTTYGARAVWSIFANNNTANLKFVTQTTFNGNVDLNIVAVFANGSSGTAGQVLASNGSATYWVSPGAASVNTAAQFGWTNIHTFAANVSFNGNGIGIASNTGAIYLGGISDANWRIGRNTGATTKWRYTNNSIDIITANSNLEGMAIGLISGNSYFETGYLGTFIASNVTIGNTSSNSTINSTAFSGTANNTSFVGTVSAANVVSNTQLSSNLANYQTTAGLSANVATLTSNNATFMNGNNVLSVMQSLRANRALHGGGTITVSASGDILWSARYIVISNGRGTHFSTEGFFNISCPTSGTITGVGGAANKTATAAGIPLGAWEALYYILPIGSNSGSLAANFRVVSYTSDVEIPSNWLLICAQNDDNKNYYFNNGIILKVSQSFAGGTFTSANMPQANNANNLGGTAAASYVQNTDSRTLSGNLVISGTSFTPSSNTILLGNSTQRWVLSANSGDFSSTVNAVTSVNSALLTVGTSFVANTTGAYHTGVVNAASHTVGTTAVTNSTAIYFGTINATSNGSVLNATTLTIGNSSVNATINSTSFTGTANNSSNLNGKTEGNLNVNNATTAYGKTEGNLNVNNALTANSSTYLGTKLEAGLNVNSALTANNSTNLGGVAAASYVQNTDSRTLSGNLTFSANVTLNGVIANGGIGSAGQVLHSDGAKVYWAADDNSGTVTSVATGNGMTGGPVTTTGTVSILANTGIVANSTGAFVNATYIGTISSNNASFLGGTAAASYQLNSTLSANVATLTSNNATNAFGKTEGNLNVNSATTALTANNSTNLGGTAASGYQTTAGLSANVATLTANNANFVKANNGITSNSLGVFVTQGTGVVVNATGVHVNAAYINTIAANSTTFVLANNGIISNSSGVFVNGNNGLITNSTGVHVLANTGIVANTTGTFVNATYIGTISANNASFLGGVAAASYVQNTDSRTLSGNLVISGTSFTPSTNTILLGNSTQRWVLSANTGSFSGAVSGITTLAAGNTTITGFANVTSTIQGGSSLTIAGALSGVTTAAMGNTTITGFANVTTSVNSALFSVGTSFIANTTGAYHTGAVNAASHTVGSIFIANSTQLTTTVPFSANGGTGTSGQVLTSNGSTGSPYWATAAGGSSNSVYMKGGAATIGTLASEGSNIFRVNANTLNYNTTIAAGENAQATGPIAVASGITLTVASGARVAIV